MCVCARACDLFKKIIQILHSLKKYYYNQNSKQTYTELCIIYSLNFIVDKVFSLKIKQFKKQFSSLYF